MFSNLETGSDFLSIFLNMRLKAKKYPRRDIICSQCKFLALSSHLQLVNVEINVLFCLTHLYNEICQIAVNCLLKIVIIIVQVCLTCGKLEVLMQTEFTGCKTLKSGFNCCHLKSN